MKNSEKLVHGAEPHMHVQTGSESWLDDRPHFHLAAEGIAMTLAWLVGTLSICMAVWLVFTKHEDERPDVSISRPALPSLDLNSISMPPSTTERSASAADLRARNPGRDIKVDGK